MNKKWKNKVLSVLVGMLIATLLYPTNIALAANWYDGADWPDQTSPPYYGVGNWSDDWGQCSSSGVSKGNYAQIQCKGDRSQFCIVRQRDGKYWLACWIDQAARDAAWNQVPVVGGGDDNSDGGDNGGGDDGSSTPSTPPKPEATAQTITFSDEPSKNEVDPCDEAIGDWAFLVCPTGDLLSEVVDHLLGWIGGLLRWNYLIDAASPGLGDDIKFR